MYRQAKILSCVPWLEPGGGMLKYGTSREIGTGRLATLWCSHDTVQLRQTEALYEKHRTECLNATVEMFSLTYLLGFHAVSVPLNSMVCTHFTSTWTVYSRRRSCNHGIVIIWKPTWLESTVRQANACNVIVMFTDVGAPSSHRHSIRAWYKVSCSLQAKSYTNEHLFIHNERSPYLGR